MTDPPDVDLRFSAGPRLAVDPRLAAQPGATADHGAAPTGGRVAQLALPFPHRPDYATADFIPAASNQDALAWLARTVDDWPDRRLALWGEAGTGKSHLLHIWVRRTGARLYHGEDLTGMVPSPGLAGVAVDDADRPAEEAALLHLLNACREAAVPVLLAAAAPPSRWGVRLPDLASRLRAIVAVEIANPDDALLGALLVRLLADRQLVVSATLRDWLLLRLPRSAAALREAVARLDEAQLAVGGGITRALAAATLGLGGEHDVSETLVPRAGPVASGGDGNGLNMHERRL